MKEAQPRPQTREKTEPETPSFFSQFRSLPHTILSFLQEVSIEPKKEFPSLSYQELKQAWDSGEGSNYPRIQKLKVKHLKDITSARLHRKSGIPMKARAQLLLQQNRELGDQTAWMLRSQDDDTTLSVAKFLLEDMQRQELWMGFAMNEDWLDPASQDKDTVTPLITRMKSLHNVKQILELMQGKIGRSEFKEKSPRLYKKNGPDTIEKLHFFHIKYMAKKLSHKLAATSEDYLELLAKEKRSRKMTTLQIAYSIIDEIKSGKTSWKKINQFLKEKDQKPISPETCFLLKLFAQDRPNWKIADLMLTQDELFFETGTKQYTPRIEEAEKTLTQKQIRIKISPQKNGKLLIIAKKQHLPWLKPLINRLTFFEALDEDVVKKLAEESPYQQIQIMLEMGADVKHLQNPSSPEHTKAFEQGKVKFATDLIWGTAESSPQNQKTPILTYPLLRQIDLNSTPTLPPELGLNNRYQNSLYNLIRKAKPTIPQNNKNNQPTTDSINSTTSKNPSPEKSGSNKNNKYTEQDRKTAKLLLENWQEIRKTEFGKKLPPQSTKKILQQIASNQRVTSPTERAFRILELRIFQQNFPA